MVKKKTGSKRKNTAPAARSDGAAVRICTGLALIAVGVLVFLSVFLHLQGNVFSALRILSFGLTGGLAFLLPFFPAWWGIRLLYPGKGSGRTAWLLFFAYLLLLASAILFTYTSDSILGRLSLMSYFSMNSGGKGTFADMLSQAYTFCSRGVNGYAGGLLGTMVAWPFWALFGNDIALVFVLLLFVVVILFLLRIDLGKVLFNMRVGMAARREEREAREAEMQKKEMEWKQAQMLRNAQRQEWKSQPQPSQFSGPAPAVRPNPTPDVSGFTHTPEENPNFTPEKKTPVRSAFSRIFTSQQANPDPADPAADQPARNRKTPKTESTPEPAPAAPVSFSPEAAWQANGMTSPFQAQSMPSPVPPANQPPVQTETEPVNPHRRRGPARPAAAFPAAPDTLPDPVSEGETSAAETPSPASGQRMPTSWQSAVADRIAGLDQTQDQSAEDEDDLMPSPDKLQQPIASWTDGKKEVSTKLPVKGEVKIPVAQTASSPSTWTPELQIKDTQGKKTYGDGAEEEAAAEAPKPIYHPYIFPDPSLLREPDVHNGINPSEDAERSQRLEETLASFKVSCHVKHVTHGPAISRFELELAQGIKLSKITDLGPNIAMNMAVKSVRIEAPIPGTSLVGVEVPNQKVSLVTLKEVLSSEKMVNATDPLVVALGRDIAGVPVICNIAKMPHMLIAGATGSGKSVCINTIIGSLLYRTSPEEVRLILIDPKVVELQCYNGIPHLLAPVVSDPHKAAGALQWAVEEMMRRYAEFQEMGVRNITGYNQKLKPGEKKLPRIVIIIDELADLMMTCKREVEEYICRIAQLARAAGIHLIVATQRPSVDVITGLIKANIPSRIAFKVSSFIDSRTILDKNGAEQLLGNGDMLYQPMGEFTPFRVQGCFLSDDEVNAIADYIRKTSSPDYDQDFVQQLSRIENESSVSAPDMADPTGDDNGDSSLLAQCIEIALLDGQVSTSLLQRRLKIGYARAGRLVDEMEKRGIVSAKDGAKPRMCLITREEYEQMKSSGALSS